MHAYWLFHSREWNAFYLSFSIQTSNDNLTRNENGKKDYRQLYFVSLLHFPLFRTWPPDLTILNSAAVVYFEPNIVIMMNNFSWFIHLDQYVRWNLLRIFFDVSFSSPSYWIVAVNAYLKGETDGHLTHSQIQLVPLYGSLIFLDRICFF